MTKDQLATRLANIDAELRRKPSAEYRDELQDAFRRTDVQFRAALDQELWESRETDLDYARKQLRMAKLAFTPSVVWDCLGRACDALERVLATDEATESDAAWTVEEILAREG